LCHPGHISIDTNSGGHIDLLDRLQKHSLEGSLAFVNDWDYFTDPKNPDFEDLTSAGPFAGTRQARDTGGKLRQRYGHLVTGKTPARFWSCSSPRDVETARYFAHGFFGPDWETTGSAELEIIPEEADREGDTLTPGDTCLEYINDLKEGHDKGYGKLEAWQRQFTKPIADRLAHDLAGLTVSHLDVYSMMEMCGFEILARGTSPWCNVFSHDEWRDFEYARDLLHFYRAGPGNKFSRAMGWLYLNATADLLVKEQAQDVYFSFVHDGDIVPLLAALKILDESGPQELPTDRMAHDRAWRTSDVVPMGGRIMFERIVCEKPSGNAQRHVRLSINDGVSILPSMSEHAVVPYTMPVGAFWRLIDARLQEFGEYSEVCGLPAGAASRVTFLHQR
jgi:acid phosphatase